MFLVQFIDNIICQMAATWDWFPQLPKNSIYTLKSITITNMVRIWIHLWNCHVWPKCNLYLPTSFESISTLIHWPGDPGQSIHVLMCKHSRSWTFLEYPGTQALMSLCPECPRTLDCSWYTNTHVIVPEMFQNPALSLMSWYMWSIGLWSIILAYYLSCYATLDCSLSWGATPIKEDLKVKAKKAVSMAFNQSCTSRPGSPCWAQYSAAWVIVKQSSHCGV